MICHTPHGWQQMLNRLHIRIPYPFLLSLPSYRISPHLPFSWQTPYHFSPQHYLWCEIIRYKFGAFHETVLKRTFKNDSRMTPHHSKRVSTILYGAQEALLVEIAGRLTYVTSIGMNQAVVMRF
jgi:hypothetical protein